MTIAAHSAEAKDQQVGSPLEVLLAFLKLGVTCFGGPIAHIGYFREEFVVRRRWLDEQAYADLVALCQFLPGPASSQVGFSIGLMRAGYRGWPSTNNSRRKGSRWDGIHSHKYGGQFGASNTESEMVENYPDGHRYLPDCLHGPGEH